MKGCWVHGCLDTRERTVTIEGHAVELCEGHSREFDAKGHVPGLTIPENPEAYFQDQEERRRMFFE